MKTASISTRTRIRTISILSLVALIGLTFVACAPPTITYVGPSGPYGPDGRAYLAFHWTTDLSAFQDTNPDSLGAQDNVYFQTYAGNYHVAYNTMGDQLAAWQFNYDIYVNPGQPDGVAGLDNYFVIDLLPNGKQIYYPTNNPQNVAAKNLVPIPNQSGSLQQQRGPILGTQHLESSQGSIDTQYGRIQK